MSGVALLLPGGLLEPMWRLNPRARDNLGRLGPWGIALMFTVSLACALSAVGVWRGAAWGRRLAVAVLVVNLLGDVGSALSGAEPRAAIGLPIGVALVLYLRSGRVHRFFDSDRRESSPREIARC